MGSGLATVQSAKEPVVQRTYENGMIKVKRKIVKKKKKADPETDIVETSTTSSTSSVFATTSESPSPLTTSATTTAKPPTTNVPNPTTTTPPLMTTQPVYPEDVTQLDISDDVTTTFEPMEGKENEEELDSALSQLLADVSLENLEQMVDELLPDHALEEEDETEPDEEIVDEQDEYEEADYVEEIDYSGTSLSACPVKEEVVAPYWANNTRHQSLALLNVYPFEQYIHMETCKFQYEEMLCRKGCRCEQQYRLHRLLAFDPKNECRGIFSDWFRLPSYCVCKCYNVPEEFIPRTQRKPKAELDSNALKNIEVQKSEENPDKRFLDPESLQNIPAFLPYEAKQALLRELSRKDRKLGIQELNKAAEVLEEVEEAQDRSSKNHFFYSNAPIMEFNLANGDSGAVGQTPRKK